MPRIVKYGWVIVVILLTAVSGHAQAWSTLLNATSGSGESVSSPQKWAVPWNNVGVPGGIPNRSTVCVTSQCMTATAAGTSATLAQLNAALASCPSGDVVLLAAGTYNITGTLAVPSNCTLRGRGTLTSSGTILNATGTSGAVVQLGTGGPLFTPTSTAITSGNTAGSNSIVVASASGISVGSLLGISEANDPVYDTIKSVSGASCTQCDGTSTNGTRTRGQTVRVTNVSGTTLTISPALYTNYGTAASTSPVLAYPFTPTNSAGVELLQVYANGTGYAQTFKFAGCYGCWVKEVFDNYTDGDHVDSYWSLNGEIRDSYFSNAYGHSPGSSDADIDLIDKSSAMLVENNICERLHVCIMIEWGAAGNVIGYNYEIGNFDSGATSAILSMFDAHGSNPQFNLFESNIGNNISLDSTWGSGTNQTLLRNLFRATDTLASPLTAGRNTVNWASTTLANQYMRGINITFPHTNTNVIGNILGSSDAITAATNGLYNVGTSPFTSTVIPTSPTTTNRPFQSWFYAVSAGYDTNPDATGAGVVTFSDGPGPAAGYWVGLASGTVFEHGNFDVASNSIIWNGVITQTIPASFYKSTKPVWFGAVPWPAIGPDVTGGNLDTITLAGHANSIPAKVCYDSESRDASGLKLFDPVSCYYSTPPNPPSGLHVVIEN